jgi:Domain of unknown function (DUF1707)
MTSDWGDDLLADAERDQAARILAEAVATGRLSLADHEVRLEAVFAAKTPTEVQAVTADLPALPVKRSGLYRAVDAHQIVVVGGTMHRTGRFTIGRFCSVTAVFGQVDLDLRAAVPSQREIDLTIRGVASRVSIIAPRWWSLNDKVLVLGMSRTLPDREAGPNDPILRLRGACIGGSLHVSQA